MIDTIAGTTQTARRGGPHRATWAGYAAFIWGILFAAAHVYWACGGTALVDAEQVREARAQVDRNPWGYITSWTILSLLFVFMGSFPLALVWRKGGRVDRRRVQRGSIGLGYAGMASLLLYGLVTQEYALAVVGCGAGALGVVVAMVRPRDQSVSRWMVLVATWIMGVAMTMYGCAYVAAAVGERGSERFLIYLVTGGASWLSGGILFLATAWLAGRERHVSRHSDERR